MKRTLLLSTIVISGILLYSQAPGPPRGYLAAGERPDLSRVMLPAPARGDLTDQHDMAIFHATRALEGSERWKLAASDNQLSLAQMMKNFSCALGMLLTNENAPRTIALLTRATADSSAEMSRLKDLYKRPRP